MRLQFQPVTLPDYDIVQKYTEPYGEGSCQHSFVAMYSLQEKYGDQICIESEFLFILRNNLCDSDYRVYLAPLGRGDQKAAFQRVLEDAHSYGKKAKFVTVTSNCVDFLGEHFPEQMEVTEERDLAEYVYAVEKLSTYGGKELRKRRQEVRYFWEDYGGRAALSPITMEDIPEILEYEAKWVAENSETHDRKSLEKEQRCIQRQLAHFQELHLTGIVVRIDGQVRGFTYGTKLNRDYFDGLIEKADRSIPNLYKVLRMELAKNCAGDCLYENIEEDVGVDSLRTMKMYYHPDFLIKKYQVTEK